VPTFMLDLYEGMRLRICNADGDEQSLRTNVEMVLLPEGDD